MTDDLFHEELIEMARHPSFYGAMENADLVLNETNASCGDQLTIYLSFAEPKNSQSLIKNLQWTGTGCIISQASMSLVAEYMQGKKIADINNLTAIELQKKLGIEEIAVGRIKCLLLGTSALKKVGAKP